MLRTTQLVILLLVCLALAGCFGGTTQVIVPAKGRVTYKGKPLPYGQVMFQPESGEMARGEIQPDGTYVLSTFAPSDGATVGKNHVRITSNPAQMPDIATAAKGEIATPKSILPKKFGAFGTSELVVEVKASGNPDFDFPLED